MSRAVMAGGSGIPEAHLREQTEATYSSASS